MTAGIKANVDGSGAIQVGGSDVIGLGTTGNVNIPTSGARITGDFSNATVANRVAFQTSTTNGNTIVYALPNGTASVGSFIPVNASDPTNAAYCQLRATSTETGLYSSKYGSGTFLPMTFYTADSERMRIDTSGNVGIGTSSPAASLSVSKQTTALSGTSQPYGVHIYPTSTGLCYVDALTDSTSSTSLGFRTYNNGTYNEMRMDSSGNVGIGTSSPGQRVTIHDSIQSNQLGLTGAQQNAMQFLNASGGAGFIVGRSLSVNNANDFFIFDAVANTNRLGIDASGNLQFNSGYGSAATAYGCRAWANFNGTLAGTNAPRAGGNVTSVTRNSTGLYTVNFTNAMPDTNYAVVGMHNNVNAGSSSTRVAAYATGNVQISTLVGTTGVFDSTLTNVVVFR